jgi:hypothetical protein
MSQLTGKALVEHRRDRLADLVIMRERQAAELAETDEAIAECIASILLATATGLS